MQIVIFFKFRYYPNDLVDDEIEDDYISIISVNKRVAATADFRINDNGMLFCFFSLIQVVLTLPYLVFLLSNIL